MVLRDEEKDGDGEHDGIENSDADVYLPRREIRPEKFVDINGHKRSVVRVGRIELFPQILFEKRHGAFSFKGKAYEKSSAHHDHLRDRIPMMEEHENRAAENKKAPEGVEKRDDVRVEFVGRRLAVHCHNDMPSADYFQSVSKCDTMEQ
jgi:hypothetical protein